MAGAIASGSGGDMKLSLSLSLSLSRLRAVFTGYTDFAWYAWCEKHTGVCEVFHYK